MIRPLLCLPLLAAYSIARPAQAQEEQLEKAAMKMHAVAGGEMCQTGERDDVEDAYQSWTFSYDLYPGAAAESEEITLIRIWCWAGAFNYNTNYSWYTYRAYEGLAPLSFAEPTLKYEHDEGAAEGTPTPFSVFGMQGTMTLTNSEYDEETRRITSNALWRSAGDASSSGIWEFVDGEWALVYFEVDNSYDGEINPEVVVDYRSGGK